MPDDPAQWEVQMHETARALSAQLDTKLGLLQSLVAEADRAAERLEQAIQRAHPALPPGSQAESLRPCVEKEREAAGNCPDAGADLERRTAGLAATESTSRSRRRDEIYELADYGFAPAEISRRLGSPIGEVELVLSLRQA